MASIKRIDGKTGVSFKITVTKGRDGSGKQIRHFMTWKPEPGMTNRQMEKEAQRAAFEFERQIDIGLRPDDRQTFQEYAEYFLESKRAAGIRPKTLDGYRYFLKRINIAIGHIRLRDIRPQHLNLLYANLTEEGINGRFHGAYPKPAYLEALKQHRQEDVASAAGISVETVQRSQRDHVCAESAKTLAAAVGLTLEEAFDVRGLDEKLSPTTIAGVHRTIHSILGQAEKEGLIPYNPANRAQAPRVPRKEAEYLEPEELIAVLEALETEPLMWRTLFQLLIVTGCRRAEIAALHWTQIDFGKSTLTVDRAMVHSEGKLLEGPTKTNRIRRLTLPSETTDLLWEYRDQQTETRLALGDVWTGTEDYLFTRENGRPIGPNAITDWTYRFCDRHGLRRFHPHTLRHSLASFLIASGLDIVSVSRRLGHAHVSMTLNTYARALEKADFTATETISKLLLKSGSAEKPEET